MFRWWQQAGPARQAKILGGIVAIIIVVILAATPKPWNFDFATAKKVRLEDYVRVYSWWAGLFNLFPLLVLISTSRWWTRPASDLIDSGQTLQRPRWFWPIVAAAVLLCAAINAPRLNHSLWDDEEYSVRRAIVGSYQQNDDGSVKLKKLPWLNTLWYYSKPTNHILQSVAARFSNDTWRRIARPEGLQFWEPAVRLPSFLAGLAAICVLAAVVRRMGYPAAGAFAAMLLALHPWYARFVPEARGYTMVFLFLALQWLFFLRVRQSGGQWRWWIAFALAQFAMLWTWPAAVSIAAVNNLLIAGWLAFSREDRKAAALQLWRWFALSCVCGMAVIQMLLPCFPQFSKYLEDASHLPLGTYWLKNVGALLVSGSHWSKTGRLDFRHAEFFPFAHQHPWIAMLFFASALALITLGAARLWRGRDPARIFPALWLLPGIVVFALAKAQGYYLYEWYVAFLVPGLAALAALGATGLSAFARSGFPRHLQWALPLIVLIGYAAVTQRQRVRLISQSVQHIRESVLLTRPSLDPKDPRNQKILTVSTILSPAIYDPLVEVAPSVESLAEYLQKADLKGFPLFLNQGCPDILKLEFPATYAMVTDQSLFEEIRDLPGIEGMLDRKVYRYKPGGIAGKDLSRYGKNPAFNREFVY